MKTTTLDICEHICDAKSSKNIIFLYEKFIFNHFFSGKSFFIISSFKLIYLQTNYIAIL